ncbi:AMP-binding protein [Algoriphagus aestuariicola]|uniref:AMP-binding protein n=1 Tax=Algoriphagus aestuariicola TaxID=1852016 RepID=A0ABS3BQ29_9BACT|nr:AMP-binding protein [Algoriphagus aestuariicola]MBN7801418.1 AMP-binding protein [Algoriphagus aestuariicola]
MFQLHIGNQVFSDAADFELDASAFSEGKKAALAFCKAWLSGDQTFFQQTSGSTGAPKRIELTRDQMQASATATGAFFKTTSDTRLLCCLSPEYIAGKMMLVRAMVWNCPVWLVEPSGNPLEDLGFIPDFVAMVPLQVEKSLNNPKSLDILKKVGNLIIGGVQTSELLKKQLAENQILAWQTYGMTETVSHIALAKINDEELLYQVLPGVEIGMDERGALWVKSPMSGTEKIQTNDLVELLSDSSFRWLGRVDFTVNSGGVKLHPELLEKRSETIIQTVFPGSQFFFFGEPDERLGNKLVLVLETEENNEKSELLLEKLSEILHPYEIPKRVRFLNSFVMTDSGKINRLKTIESQC